MPESLIQVTEGTGKKLHTFQRTIGANNIEDEVVIQGEPYLATYGVSSGTVSTATVDSHIIQIMAGASLNVYIRRIVIYQTVVATAAALAGLELRRLSTAGTGGTAVTVSPLDTTDSASGASGMTLPTVKGTEGTLMWAGRALMIQTLPTGGPGSGGIIVDLDFDRYRIKSPRIAAGVANGVAVKWQTAVASGQVQAYVYLQEANF